MLLEALLLSSGTGYLLVRKPEQRRQLFRRAQLAATQARQTAQRLVPASPARVDQIESPKHVAKTFSFRQLIKDIRQSTQARGRDDLKVDINPELQAMREAQKKATSREMWLSAGAMGLALLGSSYPVFAIAAAGGIFYLSRETFILIWRDFKRGHYFSVYLLGLVMTLGMIFTGHLLLAAFAGLIGNFFAKIINRVEEDSQNQLISVFGGHPEKVWVLKDDVEVQIDFHALQIGDRVIVNAGEVIPVDGVILHGEGQADQHLLTGESQPAEKNVGDNAFAATLLLSGRLTIEVNTTGEATLSARIGDVLNQTQNYKDKLMSRGQKIADRFLPVEIGVSAITLPVLGPTAAVATMWSALGAGMAPLGSLTVLNYLQILSTQSILIKDGRVFESLRQIDTVVFDKTGTLTLEQPTVGQIHPFGEFDQNSVLRYAAAAEYRQPHPIAKAIIACAQQAQLELPAIDEANYEVGYGIKVNINDSVIRVGSARFIQREGIQLPQASKNIQQHADANSHSLIYVGIDDQLAGVLEMQPTIRPEARQIVEFLKQRDIALYIISGDHAGPTQKMAQTLGIDNYFAEVLPEHKAQHVEKLKDAGRFVCFVGDGINDAIAMKTAQVSISLKGASTAATDTAQIIFMDGTLNKLSRLFQLMDEFENTMQKNLVISFAPGIFTIGGIYFLHFGIAASMGVFYLGCFAGLGNIFWPLVKHQNALEPSPDKKALGEPKTSLNQTH